MKKLSDDSMDLTDQIVKLFSEKMALEVSSIEDDLVDTGVLDSLALMNLLIHLENEFGLTIPLDELDLEYFRCIAAIARFIKQRAAVG